MTKYTWPRLVKVPDDWEQRVQVTLIAPPVLIKVPGDKPKVAPRSNLVVSITPAQGETSDEARAKFLEQTQQAVPGLELKEERPEKFDDDVLGSGLVVEFNATPETKLRQTHLFRVDDDVLVQIVATVDSAETSEEDEQAIIGFALTYTAS